MVDVSVVLTAYNEEKHLGRCLESLVRQVGVSFEVVVVDDGSSDGTFDVAKSFVEKCGGVVRVVRLIRNLGPGNARNIGAVYARGRVLVFLDADMEVPEDFLRKVVYPITEGGYDASCYGRELVANLDNPWVKVYGQKVRGVTSSDYIGFVRAIRRELFLEAGGFDARLGYFDDVSFHEKTGIRSVVVKDAFLYHHNPDTAREVIWRNFWIGKSVLKRHRKTEVSVMVLKRLMDLSVFPGAVAFLYPATLVVGVLFLSVFGFLVARHRVLEAGSFSEKVKLRLVYVPVYRVLRAAGFLAGFVYSLLGGGWVMIDTRQVKDFRDVVQCVIG